MLWDVSSNTPDFVPILNGGGLVGVLAYLLWQNLQARKNGKHVTKEAFDLTVENLEQRIDDGKTLTDKTLLGLRETLDDQDRVMNEHERRNSTFRHDAMDRLNLVINKLAVLEERVGTAKWDGRNRRRGQ